MQLRHALTERLADLKSWRLGSLHQIERITNLLQRVGYLDEALATRLAALQKRVQREKVTVAFIAEAGRGKSELVNALFFADSPTKLLPSGFNQSTRCTTELQFRRDEQSGIRLLPIESRESPRRLEDFEDSESDWRTVLFDADNPESLRRAFGTLSETRRIHLNEAVAWGLHSEALGTVHEGGWVDVPRWRYAKINFPHPLLDAGLVVIDTPGIGALTAEPELARKRIPNADAVILVIDASEGVTKADISIWKDQLGGGRNLRERERDESRQTRLIALNKIDMLRKEDVLDPKDADRDWLHEIDLRVQDVADLLRVEPIKVIPVSAKLAEQSRQQDSQDLLMRSRVYQLSRALAQNLPRDRQAPLALEISTRLSDAIEDAQTKLDQERFDKLEGLRMLDDIRHKNETLSAAVNKDATDRIDMLQRIIEEIATIRPVHAKLNTELKELSDTQIAQNDIDKTKLALSQSVLPSTVTETIEQYFRITRRRVMEIESKIEEVRSLFSNIGENVYRSLELGAYELHPFATQRFMSEVDRAEEKARTELSRTSNLLMRRGTPLADQFEFVVSPTVMPIFNIAHRELPTWMKGLYHSLERPVDEVNRRLAERAAKVEMIRSVELDLAEKISEIQASLDIIKSKHNALEGARETVKRFAQLQGQMHGQAEAASS
jgi:GTPase SAR1 family protein